MLLLSSHFHLSVKVPVSCTEVCLYSRYHLVYPTGVSYTMSTSQYRSSFRIITLEIKGAHDALGNHDRIEQKRSLFRARNYSSNIQRIILSSLSTVLPNLTERASIYIDKRHDKQAYFSSTGNWSNNYSHDQYTEKTILLNIYLKI